VRAQFNQIKLACATSIRSDRKELAKCYAAYKKFCVTVRPQFGQIKKGLTSRTSWYQRKVNLVGGDIQSAQVATPRHALAQLFLEEGFDESLMSVISEVALPTAGYQRTLNLTFEGDWSGFLNKSTCGLYQERRGDSRHLFHNTGNNNIDNKSDIIISHSLL
jgi:hypothetical protein